MPTRRIYSRKFPVVLTSCCGLSRRMLKRKTDKWIDCHRCRTGRSFLVGCSYDTRYVETFVVESWAEHLRQHDRATMADKSVEEAVIAFHQSVELPRVSHLIMNDVRQAPNEPKG